ncbi:MAG: hypothetical protein ACMV14_03075 [Prevotella sp.]
MIRLEQDPLLGDDTRNDSCSQFPTSGYFEDEGSYGSLFTIQIR